MTTAQRSWAPRRPVRGRVLVLALASLALLALWAAPQSRLARLPAPTLPGRLVYTVAGNLWSWQGGPRQLTTGGHDGAPAIAPDGQQIAYVRYDDSFSDLVVAPLAGGAPQFLTNNRPSAETGSHPYVQQAVWALDPAWAPAGDRLAYVSDQGTDAPVLWIMTPAGANPHSLQTTPPNPPIERPRWSPQGTAILATSMGSGKDEVWSLNLDTSVWNEVAAPPDGAYDGAWSPDGTWVAYAGRTGAQTDLWIVPADRSAAPAQLTHLGRVRAPVFAPDGQHLAFLAEKDQRFQIFVVDLTLAQGAYQAGSPQQVTDGADGVDAAAGLAWGK